jgi:glycosyltransferase involved in cell wall biosynthesis
VIHGHIPLATSAALNLYGEGVRTYYTIHSPAKMEMSIEWKNSDIARRLTMPIGLLVLNRIEADCLRRSCAITCLSQYTKDCVRKIHGDSIANKVVVIPGWVDTSRFNPAEDRESIKAELGWPIDVPVLFTLRRLVPRMGLDRLLDAFHKLVTEGVGCHLVIGGDGPLRSKLEQQSKSLGLSESVTFMGRIADDWLPSAYAACDAFVLPSSELECFGLIAIEALSAGRPVLASPAGAIPEIIREFEPAWLARSSETSDIADLLRQFLLKQLPRHAPMELHDRTASKYSRQLVLRDFIEATIGNRRDRGHVS